MHDENLTSGPGPCACVASALVSEPSPWPHDYTFKQSKKVQRVSTEHHHKGYRSILVNCWKTGISRCLSGPNSFSVFLLSLGQVLACHNVHEFSHSSPKD